MKNLAPFILLPLLMLSCGILKDDPKPKAPAEVVTNEVTAITPTTATVSGEVVTDGNPATTERGFTYGIESNPSVDGAKIAVGKGIGAFTAELTGLTPGKGYHVRAYAVNKESIAYGSDRTFTTSTAVPTLTTTAPTGITFVSLTTGGNVTSDGGASITARGICWNTTGTPTLADNKTLEGAGSGLFNSTITDLKSNFRIFVRAYATNSAGTGYGNQLEMSTLKVVPTNGLVGWWPFNGDAKDESGNGNNGLISGATLAEDRFNQPKSSYRFNGTSDFIDLPAQTFENGANTQTIALWFNAESMTDQWPGNTLLNTIPHPGVGIVLSFEGSKKLSLFKNSNPASFVWDIFHNQQFKFTGFTVNNWYQAVIVKNGNDYKFYVNGQLDNTATGTVSPVSYLCSLKIGAIVDPSNINNSTFFFHGSIDDLAIWNRALSADEILRIYNNSGFQ